MIKRGMYVVLICMYTSVLAFEFTDYPMVCISREMGGEENGEGRRGSVKAKMAVWNACQLLE